MLNSMYRDVTLSDGTQYGITETGVAGHAVFGPYKWLEPGSYVVEFDVREADPGSRSAHVKYDDVKVGTIDVVSHAGQLIHGSRDVFLSDVRNGNGFVKYAFVVEVGATYECRFFVTGAVSLHIGSIQRIAEVSAGVDPEYAAEIIRFPKSDRLPQFMSDNLALFKSYYDRGATISFENNEPVLTIEGVSFFAREPDDLLFVSQVLWEKIYGLHFTTDCCAIDIGMNIGLATMQLACKTCVREVHSFEPFKRTYERAVDNIALNTAFREKITAYNFGLAGKSETLQVRDWKNGDSGMNSMRSGDGELHTIEIRDASTTLAPIIRRAQSKGLAIIAKIDCEGAEFDVLQSLSRSKLLQDVTAIMMEYHPCHETLSKYHLAKYMTDNGFVVFDPSSESGNGMMYAVRTAKSERWQQRVKGIFAKSGAV